MSSPAVRWDVGEPAKAIEPKVAPPSVPNKKIQEKIEFMGFCVKKLCLHATPPKATSTTRNLNGGPLNH